MLGISRNPKDRQDVARRAQTEQDRQDRAGRVRHFQEPPQYGEDGLVLRGEVLGTVPPPCVGGSPDSPRGVSRWHWPPWFAILWNCKRRLAGEDRLNVALQARTG